MMKQHELRATLASTGASPEDLAVFDRLCARAARQDAPTEVEPPEPIKPALVPPQDDELDPATVPQIGRPDKLLHPSRWITNPSASAMSLHICNDANPDGTPDMQRLRGRVLLGLAWPGQTLVALLHPEHAVAIAQGLAACARAAMEPPQPQQPNASPDLLPASPATAEDRPVPTGATTHDDTKDVTHG